MPSLSTGLAALVDPGTEWDIERQDTRDKPWTPPAEVDARDKGEARNKLPLALRAAAPCGRETVKDWLNALGVMCAGQMTATDAKAKISVYAANLDHPALCFTQETLGEAGRKFKWFPSYAEVIEFLDAKARPARALAYRLKKISEAPEREHKPAQGQTWRSMTPEQREQFKAMMGGLHDSLRSGMSEQEKREADKSRQASEAA